MPSEPSVDKSLEELSSWGQADPNGLAAYTFALQTEVRRLRDSAAQNSRNSSRPPLSKALDKGGYSKVEVIRSNFIATLRTLGIADVHLCITTALRGIGGAHQWGGSGGA